MKMRPGEPPRVTGVDSPARHKVSLAPSAGELAKLARLLLIMALVQQLHPTSPVLCSLSVADVFGSRPSDQPNATTSESSTAPSRRNSTPTDIVDTQREQLLRLLQAEYSNKNATRHEATLPASEPASASSMVHAEPLGRQNNYTDSSGPPSQVLSMQFPLYMRIIATFACLVIFTIGVCGNLLVPLVVIKTKYLRNSTNLFLINLSIADLLVLIVCMPTVLIELHSRPETWLLGEAMCKLSNFVEMLAANGSIFTILAISFERYYAICKPLKAGYKCTRLRATIIICVIWLLACILTSPILIMAKSSQTIYIDGSLVYNCILETDTYWPKMYVFVSMFAFFCLPLVVLILVYCLISRRLIRQNIATMDTYSNDHCDRHGSISQTGSGFERQAQPDSKRISMKRRRSLKPIASFFALVGNNHVHFNQKDPCEADSEPLKDQRHPMLVEKINSVLISQLNVSKTASAMAPPVGRALPINKTKSLDCHKTVHMRDDVFVPDTEGDKCAKPAGRPTWSHSNEDTRANHNYPEDIIVNKTFSPKECSPQSSGFISQLLKFRIFNFAQRAHKHSMANGSSNRTDLVDGEPSVTRSTCVTESNGCNGDAAGCKNDPPGRPKLISAFSCPSGAETERMFTKDRCDNYDAHQVPFVSSEKGSILAPYTIYRQAKCDDQVVEKMNNKRRLESKKKQANGTKGIRARSRFKWVKDSSISSATGSTYTNSTLLTSESSSKTPSLSKYSHYSATRQPIGIGAKSKSRASPTLGDGNKCAHLNVCDKTIGPGMKLAQTDATLLSTNSNSFSVSCDADNSSENSSSPGCLSTAPDVSKSSWLVSLAFQEHQYHHQIAQRQLNREHEAVIAQSNSGTGDRLPEETMDADKALLSGEDYLLELDYEEDSRQATQTSTDYTRDSVGFHTSINSGSYADKCATREGDNKFGRNGANERRKVKQKIVRSLTEDRQPCGRAKLKPTQSALVPLYEKLNCDKKMANPANKYTSKMSLVTVAHNLSDNLHLKHTSRRSGSQPSVSNQLMVNGTGELLAVRDASKKQQMDSRRQVVVMLAFVVACFFLLFFPYRVFTIWLILSTEDQVQSLGMETYYNLTYFSRILIYLHSAINPIAYNLISTKFRRAFMSILLCRGSAARRNFTSEAYRNINEAKTNREKNKTNGSTKPLKSPKCDKDDLHG